MHLTYRWRATLVIALGLLMSVLDVTIVSVVLPQIATALHAAAFSSCRSSSSAWNICQLSRPAKS
jgi:MFS family permease